MIDRNLDDNIIELGLSAFVSDQTHGEFPIKNNNYQMTFKTELKSFLITFAVSFAIVLVAQIDALSLETIKDGTILGVIFGAVRAGVKGVLELVIAKFS